MDTIFCEFHTIINPWVLCNRNFTFKLLWVYDWNKVSQSLVIHQSHLKKKLWELCWFYAPFWPFVKHGDWRWSILRKFPCTLNKILLLNSNKKTVRQAFRLFSDKNNEPPKKGAKTKLSSKIHQKLILFVVEKVLHMLSLLGDQYYFEEKSEVEINVVKRNNISWSVQVLTPKIIFNRKDLRWKF